MKNIILSVVAVLLLACNANEKVKIEVEDKIEKNNTNKISVLNFGTIHLSGSTDAHSSITDVNDPKVKKDIKKIVDRLVAFKPTIICVEIPPESTDFMNETFQKYKTNQKERINYSEEVNAIGLEVARLSGTKKIYGIDNPTGFDYPSLIALANQKTADSLFVQNIMNSYETLNKKPLLEQYATINTSSYKSETFDLYNFLATMHSPGHFEGAEIIAQFYERNLKMYTNFSGIPFKKEDRVLVLMGATHTAYFDVFIGNCTKYFLEDATKYTNYSE